MMDLARRLMGQIRVAPAGKASFAIGVDLSAALALGAALGISARLIAEWMPAIELVMVSEFNKRVTQADERDAVLGMGDQ